MEIGTRVRVKVGRNSGETGIVANIQNQLVYVDFNRGILINEGFGSCTEYPDGYWVNINNVESC